MLSNLSGIEMILYEKENNGFTKSMHFMNEQYDANEVHNDNTRTC